MKTKLRILALLMALVMCLSLFVGCGSKEKADDDRKDSGKKDKETVTEVEKIDPKEEPNEAVGAAIADLVTSYGEAVASPLNVFEKAADSTATYEFKAEIQGVDVVLTAMVDPDSSEAYAKVSADLNGIPTNAELWLGEDIAVKVPDLLGEGTYGINVKNFEDDLESSPLLAAMGLTLDELYEALEDEMGMSIDDLLDTVKSMTDTSAAEEATEQFIGDFKKIIDDLACTVSEDKYDGEDAYLIEYTITGADGKKFLDAFVDYVTGSFSNIIEMSGEDVEDFRDELMDDVEYIEEDESVAIGFWLMKKDMSFAEAYVKADDDNVITFAVEGDGVDKTFIYELKEETDDYVNVATVEVEVEAVDSKGEDGFNVEVTVSEKYDDEDDDYDYENSDTVEISLVRATESGEFEFSIIADDDEVFVAEGTLLYDKNSFELGLTSVELDGEEVGLGVSVAVKAGGDVPKLPLYKNVLTMGEDDWADLVGEIEDSPLAGLFTGAEVAVAEVKR